MERQDARIVKDLNTLLKLYDLPRIRDITEATPSLLIALYECLVGSRLPISDTRGRAGSDKAGQIAALLKCISQDILRTDLTCIDPLRVSGGHKKALTYLVEILISIGRILTLPSIDADEHEEGDSESDLEESIVSPRTTSESSSDGRGSSSSHTNEVHKKPQGSRAPQVATPAKHAIERKILSRRMCSPSVVTRPRKVSTPVRMRRELSEPHSRRRREKRARNDQLRETDCDASYHKQSSSTSPDSAESPQLCEHHTRYAYQSLANLAGCSSPSPDSLRSIAEPPRSKQRRMIIIRSPRSKFSRARPPTNWRSMSDAVYQYREPSPIRNLTRQYPWVNGDQFSAPRRDSSRVRDMMFSVISATNSDTSFYEG